jgi:transcription antitermination protein NusB
MPSRSRRRSRILAVQVLFEADTNHRPLALVLQRQLTESSLDEDAQAYTRALVEGIDQHRDEIDDTIRRHAPAFPLEEMAGVDRNVLRLAIYEMLFDTGHAPLRVAINEAVDIAKGYGAESSGRFVNGVLGAVALEAAQQNDSQPGNAGESGAGD